MRRVLLCALIVFASAAQAAPPTGATATPAATVAAASLAALYHQDGLLTDRACWTDSRSNRRYCLVVTPYIAHSGSVSHATVWMNCTRSYGDTTVSTPCNWSIGPFQLLRFTVAYGSAPAEVFTSGDPADPKCRTGPVELVGTDRTVGFPGLDPWQLARVSGVTVRFLTVTGCRSLHLTNRYHAGSRRVNTETASPHPWATDPTYTGLHGI